MAAGQKLELTWIGKDKEERVEPRILIYDKEKSYGDQNTGNMLIHGDNLLALKSLEQEYAGKIKCVYIDPPYNTKKLFFESYDDNVEHSLWLSFMKERIAVLWKLLTEDNGVLLISINDDECHYLKVLCDEICGRKNFITTLIWNYEGNTDNQAKIINYHEYILVYSKSGEIDDPNVVDPNIPSDSKLFNEEIRNTIIKNGPKNPIKNVKIPKGFPASFEKGIIKKENVNYPHYSDNVIIKDFHTTNEVIASSGWSSKAILSRFINNGFNEVIDSKGQTTKFELKNTGAIEAVKKRKKEKGHVISVLRGFGTTNQMSIMLSNMSLKFTYPKPVNLIKYLIEVFSAEDDIILDAFAGSGTTAHAVMDLNLEEKHSNRKFILLEIHEKNMNEVIIPRINSIIDGCDAVEIQKHGGGYCFYELAPSLLKRDDHNQLVFNYDAYDLEQRESMIAEAIAKLNGYHYAPVEDVFWKQGMSHPGSYIYTTTQYISATYLDGISKSMNEDECLLVCCPAFDNGLGDRYDNIVVKKIPQSIWNKCEFGRKDYMINIIEDKEINEEDDGVDDDE